MRQAAADAQHDSTTPVQSAIELAKASDLLDIGYVPAADEAVNVSVGDSTAALLGLAFIGRRGSIFG